MMTMSELRIYVQQFNEIWFPADQSFPKYWFRARDSKFKNVITQLCEKHAHVTHDIISQGSIDDILARMRSEDWSPAESVILAIMVDQMPRNALAINFREFRDADPKDVSAIKTDSFSHSLAAELLKAVNLRDIRDIRVICFFSLIFRHANDFPVTRLVLSTLQRPDGTLPDLAQKFWNETEKREQSLTASA
jgi:hypothetical protein